MIYDIWIIFDIQYSIFDERLKRKSDTDPGKRKNRNRGKSEAKLQVTTYRLTVTSSYSNSASMKDEASWR